MDVPVEHEPSVISNKIKRCTKYTSMLKCASESFMPQYAHLTALSRGVNGFVIYLKSTIVVSSCRNNLKVNFCLLVRVSSSIDSVLALSGRHHGGISGTVIHSHVGYIYAT